MGVVVTGFGAAIVYGAVQLGHIPRIACRSCQKDGSGAMNVLVVGSDSRAALAGEGAQFGTPQTVSGQRSDTIMVVRIEPNREKASVLSIPRDLYVPIASGGSDRINSAFERGPDNLVRTITATFGIPIHHYVEVDFAGFRDIVSAVGGVSVWFSAPSRDRVSGLRVDRTGCVPLDGNAALAYVRSRHYETMTAGRWQFAGADDLDRIGRQQDFIRRVLSKVRGVRNPLTIHHLVTTGTHNVTFDKRLSAGEIERLAVRLRSLLPSSLDMQTVPADYDFVVLGGRRSSVLRMRPAETSVAVDRFLGRVPPPTSAAPTAPSTPTTPPSTIVAPTTTSTVPGHGC
jgi:LCP family protein required for cell wall assembly